MSAVINKYSILWKIFFFSLSFVSLLAGKLCAQTGSEFNRVAVSNEKANLAVTSIVRDSRGLMWFGTNTGLFQFDGYKYKEFKTNYADSRTISDNRIFDICEDKNGSIWIATFSGISQYHRATSTFSRFEIINNPKNFMENFILQVGVDKNERVLAKRVFSGLYELNHRTNKFEQFLNEKDNLGGFVNKNIIDSYIDKSGTLWFCVNDKKSGNVLYKFDYETKRLTNYTNHPGDPLSISSLNMRKIFKDSKGNIWIGLESGLDKLDVNTGKFKHYLPDEGNGNSISDGTVISMEEDDDGMIWIGTEGKGLNKLNPATGKFIHFKSNIKDEKALLSDIIHSLYNDNAGTLWIGTGNGLNTQTLRPKKFNNYLFASRDGTIANPWQIKDLKTGKDGATWFCTENGLYRFDKKNKPVLLSTLAGSTELVQEKSGKFWVGGMEGLANFDPLTKTTERYYIHHESEDSLNVNVIWTIYLDEQETLWVGTGGGGLHGIDLKTKKEIRYLHNPANANSISSNEIGIIYRDKNILWVGSYKHGLNSINLENGKIVQYTFNPQQPESLSFPVVTAIYRDKKGRLWVGTDDGLNLLLKNGKTFRRFKEKEGLANTSILHESLHEDSQGNIWMSTKKGISKLNPETFAVSNYDARDGFQFNEEAILAKDDNGEMILFGINGFTTFRPEEVTNNPHPAPVSICAFQIFNKNIVPGGSSPIKSVIAETKEITLSYKESFFTLEFAAQNYILTEKNQYAYMLEGFEKEWNYSGTRRVAYYTNVPPGNYTFKVKASNNDGLWNEQGTSLKIIITPPFWLTWWFRMAALLIIAGSIITFYVVRMTSVKRRQKILEQKVNEQTIQLVHLNGEERMARIDAEKAREEADHANNELENKNQELEQFVYIASHDLREPLRTTSSFVELLRKQYKGKLDEKADSYLSYITQSGDRMTTLINDLLDYSKIGTSKEMETIDCNALLVEVLSDLAIAVKEAGAEITVGRLPVLWGHRTAIKQLFQNLATNGIKFRKKDTAPVIKISAEPNDDCWQFSFVDNGIGIEKKNSEKIFVIFQRLHTRKEYEGSGIGLSHCKKIVEMHKGNIWLESQLGKGTTFYFTIPYKTITNEKQIELRTGH